jgi:phage repressor protein C with HTH and peptisase S24 domain
MVQINDLRAAFTARLKKALAAKGIPEWGAGARLKEVADVTPKAASKWLNAESMPGAAKMKAIADFLEVKIEWLQFGSGEYPLKGTVSAEHQFRVEEPKSAADAVREMFANSGRNVPEALKKKIIAVADAEDSNVVTVDFSRPGLVGDEVWIAHYDIRGAMGGGQSIHDFPEMLKDIRVSPSHLRELGVEFDEHYHLKLVTGWGQSMEPTIKHRDPLIVNVHVREFIGDGIYLFFWDDHVYIKRLQVADEDHFEMISDNTRHKDRLIRRDMTYVQARVLLVWNAHLL